MGPRVVVLGSSGMAGHLFTLYFKEREGFAVVDVGPRQRPFDSSLLCDMEDRVSIEKLLKRCKADVVINCIGVLVKASTERKREAVWINSYFPWLLNDLCGSLGMRLIHLSTDCVFSGKNGPYTESAVRDGSLFYDRSKALGELDDAQALTIRTSIIGPELKRQGSGLFNWFLSQKGTIEGYSNALWSGVTTLELAKQVSAIVRNMPSLKGIVHLSVNDGISKYELLKIIAATFSRPTLIREVMDPHIDKRLINTRLDFPVHPAPYVSQIVEIRDWVVRHVSLYGRYLESI